MPLDLLHLTDPHLLADPEGMLLGCSTRHTFGRVIAHAAAGPPADLVLLTGDLSQDGCDASYTAVRETLMPLGLPCYALPGNHDVPGALYAALETLPFRHATTFAQGGWRFHLLNSAVPDEVHGRLSEATLRTLAEDLAAHPDTPTALALHHPPVPTGTAWLDPLTLHAPDELLRLVAEHTQVRLVLCGHVHQELDVVHAQARILATPSTCFQFTPGAPTFDVAPASPGYRRIRLFPNGTVDTWVERVGCAVEIDPAVVGY